MSDVRNPEQKLKLKKKMRWGNRFKKFGYVLNTILLILVVYLLLHR